MLRRMRIKLLLRLRLRESWVILFIMGFIMMNFPFLHIFNKSDTVFGLPLMFLYLFVGWGISILIIYLFTLANGDSDEKHPETRQ